MKLHVNRIENSIACLLGGMLLLASCEQSENGNNYNEPSDKEGVCTILPPFVTIEPFGADADTRAVAAPIEEQLYPIADELSSILTIANTPEENTPQTRALATGTYYQLVIYKQAEWDNGTLVIAEQRLCKTGSTNFFDNSGNPITNPIQLSQGQYKVFCYSYNSTTATNLTLSSGPTSLSMPDGIDFLSAVIDMEITGAQLGSSIAVPAISLEHRCCKLTGTLTADYFDEGNQISTSDPIPKLQVTGNFTSSCIWNIKNSVPYITATATAKTKSIDLNLTEENMAGSIIVLPLSEQILKATYSFKPVKALYAVNGTNIPLSSANTKFTTGSNHTFTIKAINAYVLSANPPTIGGVKWATSNLQANKTFADKPWSGGKEDGANDNWRWGTMDVDESNELPTGIGSIWAGDTDPCTKVSEGKWRMPSASEYTGLKAAVIKNKRVYINGKIRQTKGYGWIEAEVGVVAGSAFADGPENVLFLPLKAIRQGTNYNTPSVTMYWTNEVSGNGNSAAYFNSCAYFVDINYRVITDGLVIRCVHD